MVPFTVVLSVEIACEAARELLGSTSAMVPGGFGGVVPPMAASTAALALTMPEPHCEQVAGNARAVLCRMDVTWSGVSVGFTDSISATTPDDVRRGHRRAVVQRVAVRARRRRAGIQRRQDAVGAAAATRRRDFHGRAEVRVRSLAAIAAHGRDRDHARAIRRREVGRVGVAVARRHDDRSRRANAPS